LYQYQARDWLVFVETRFGSTGFILWVTPNIEPGFVHESELPYLWSVLRSRVDAWRKKHRRLGVKTGGRRSAQPAIFMTSDVVPCVDMKRGASWIAVCLLLLTAYIAGNHQGRNRGYYEGVQAGASAARPIPKGVVERGFARMEHGEAGVDPKDPEGGVPQAP
jgi:hypothetical protein